MLKHRITPDALQIADRAVVADIESMSIMAGRTPDGRPIYDTRPMLDRREHCDESIEMATQALRFARQRGLVREQPGQPYLLTINPQAQA